MSQIAAATVNVVADAPAPDQGDAEANPTPAPSASRSNEIAAAAKAPPMIAPQDIAEVDDSWTEPVVPYGPVRPASGVIAMRIPLMPRGQCQNSTIRMMIGMGIPSSQSRIPRPMCSSLEAGP
jgi:hypothetical protein